MKRNFIDKVIGFFSPDLEIKRIKSRLALRSYDAAKTFSTDDWSSAKAGSANSEINGAQSVLRDKGSDAVRNNPWAASGVDIIVTHTVGPGILPQIRGKNDLHTKELITAWKEWGQSTLCDANGEENFYMMQELLMRSMVERGEALALKEVNPEAMQLRLLESDFIVSDRNPLFGSNKSDNIIQGLKVNSQGKVSSYFLYDSHPGDLVISPKVKEFPADEVCHLFRKQRIGQRRGISWFHNVIRTLEDLNQYEQATLIGKKIAACFAAFITESDEDQTLSASQLITKRQNENMINPGSIRYLSKGQSMVFASPPKADGFDEYTRTMLRKIASGLGVTYEALTKDYSQVNYSSARAAHLLFKKNIENWRWNILIPKFCDPAFQHFLHWCQIVKGISIDGVAVEWIPPTWEMLDPGKEISAMNDGIRAGLVSYQRACRELGYEPDDTLEEIAAHNKRLDELEIVLDSDPRKVSKAGLLQISSITQPLNSDGEDDSEKNIDSKESD